jgi:hypothetical protein
VRELPVVLNLSPLLCREIGRVITRHAYLEWRLSKIIYALLSVGPKEGRLAVREPRATDRLVLIRDLVHLKGLEIRADLDLLAEAIDSVTRQRDQLAHGIWLRDSATQTFFLRLTKVSGSP